MEDKTISYEEAMNKLETIVQTLDRGEVGLDESITLFKEGLSMVQACRAQLDKAEGEIKILMNGEFTDLADQA